METQVNQAVSSNLVQQYVSSIALPKNVLTRVKLDTQKDSSPKKANAIAFNLKAIASERKLWESNAYRTSNQQLYAILSNCYAFYLAMAETGDDAKTLRKELNSFMKSNSIRCNKGTHGLAKIVKCVFFDGNELIDRRRISAYSLALRCALDASVKPAALAQFIDDRGGIEELRRVKPTNRETSTDRAERARTEIQSAVPMSIFRNEAMSQEIDATEYEAPFVALVLKRANGEIALHSLIKNKSVINAALVAYDTDLRKSNAKTSK